MIPRIKTFIYSILPSCIKLYIENRRERKMLDERITATIEWDRERLFKYGFRYNRKPEALLKNLRMLTHFIEKGLTMPNPRPAFGIMRLRQIANLVEEIGPGYRSSHEMQYITHLMDEYKEFHSKHNVELPDEHAQLIARIKRVVGEIDESMHIQQRHYTRSDYFNCSDGSFSRIAESRHSVRTYTDKPIPQELFRDVAKIAATAPSACNRQPCRIHVIYDKVLIHNIINLGVGCSGFGEQASAFILVTSDLICRDDITERHQVGVDAGFFGMNLLYALHEKNIGACVLNWDNIKPIDLQLRQLVPTIKDSETCIFIISCGYTPDEFDIPLGLKVSVDNIIDFIQ